MGESALELVEGGRGSSVSPGADQVEHGLRLHQVEAAIQEGAPGELTGFRRTGARLKDAPQYLAGNRGAAMALDFHHVLTGEAVGRAKNQQQGFIHRPPTRIHHMARNKGKGRTLRGQGTTAAEHRVRNGQALGPRNAHDGDSALSRRGGDGGYGFSWSGHIHWIKTLE